MELAIIIPTKGRPKNLKTSLTHNVKFAQDVPIVVVDASDEIFVPNDTIRESVTIVRAEAAGQYNQKSQGVSYIKENFPNVSHVLFIDDDIYLDRNIKDFLLSQYKRIRENIASTTLSVYVEDFGERNVLFDFIKTHSFQPGHLSRNTFGSRVCVGEIAKLDWALGGCSCWPIGFTPDPSHGYDVEGKAYLEDAFLALIHKSKIKIFSTEKTGIRHVDQYVQSLSFKEQFHSGIAEMRARKLICRRFDQFSLAYLRVSSIGIAIAFGILSLVRLSFAKTGYSAGILFEALRLK